MSTDETIDSPTLPRSIYVPLHPIEALKLRLLARAERRRPQDQAAVLLAGALATIRLPREKNDDAIAE